MGVIGILVVLHGSRLMTALIFHSGPTTVEHSVHVARLTHIVLAALTIVVLLGLIYSRNRNVVIALIVAAGLLYGPFFPNLMAILLSHFAPEVHGRAVGMLFGMASVGWTIFRSSSVASRTKALCNAGFLSLRELALCY